MTQIDAPARAQPATPTEMASPAPSPLLRRKDDHHGEHSPVAGMVMRGPDMVGLIAMLPWWRIDDARPAGPESGQYESPILTSCDVWLGFPYATSDTQSLTVRLAAAQHASEIELALDRIHVADPNELNEIDMAAPPEKPKPTNWGWIAGALAVLVGAGAAAWAARHMLAWRTPP